MIDLIYDTSTDMVRLARSVVIKAGSTIPVRLTFSSVPSGSVSDIQISLGTEGAAPSVLAFNEDFEQESSVLWTASLDANDTRLMDYMNGRKQVDTNAELVLFIDGYRQAYQNLTVTVQPPIITGPTTSEGGPVYLTESNADGLYVPQSGFDGEVKLGTDTAGTWGASTFTQTGKLTIAGALYADSATGEHILINSADPNIVGTTGVRANTLAFWTPNGACAAARFLRPDGYEMGAVGFLPHADGSTWYADGAVYLSASSPISPNGVRDAEDSPPVLMLAQEGGFQGNIQTTARLKFDEDWTTSIHAPAGAYQFSISYNGRVQVGPNVATNGSPWFEVQNADPIAVNSRVKNTYAGGEAQFAAESGSGNIAVLSAFHSTFSYHAYPPNGAAVISSGSGGLALMSTAGGSSMKFFVGGDENTEKRMELSSTSLNVSVHLNVSAGGIKFPTADPHIAGAWWDNAGTLTRSAG